MYSAIEKLGTKDYIKNTQNEISIEEDIIKDESSD
jgi:hypothetical protein